MRIFKKILSVFLCVCILSMSAGNLFFDSSHMEKVEAAEVVAGVGLTATTIFEICLFVGAVVGTVYLVDKTIENREEIAKLGKDFIDSVADIPDSWIFNFTDSATGQEYVIGSEALQLIQDTPWEVIQGGKPSGDDNNNKNGWKDKLLNLFSPVNQMVGGFTALGATWLLDIANKIYQKFTNNEPLTDSEQAVIDYIHSSASSSFTKEDIAAQWTGEPFTYNVYFRKDYIGYNGKLVYQINEGTFDFSYPIFGYYADESNLAFRYIYGNGQVNSMTSNPGKVLGITYPSMTGEVIHYDNYSYLSFTLPTGDGESYSYSFNFPVFGSYEQALSYISTGSLDGALNYAEPFEVADWLADSSYWHNNELLEALSGMNLTIEQILQILRSLGEVGNAQGVDSSEELASLIGDALSGSLPDLFPGTEPVEVPDPPAQPEYYPSPDAHPVPDPVPVPDPDPVPEPDPGLSEDIDIPDLVPDASSSFSDIGDALKKKFPFSLPWDIYLLLSTMADEPKTPVFKLPLKLERYGIDETVVIDMSKLERISQISRFFFSLLYAYALINWTVKIVSVAKE